MSHWWVCWSYSAVYYLLLALRANRYLAQKARGDLQRVFVGFAIKSHELWGALRCFVELLQLFPLGFLRRVGLGDHLSVVQEAGLVVVVDEVADDEEVEAGVRMVVGLRQASRRRRAAQLGL